MKKRLMAAGLVVLMAATAFTGCSKVKKIDDSTEATTAEAETMARVDVDVDIPDFSSYVTLGDYTGIDIDVDSAEVTDKQLEQAKQNVIKNKTTQEHVTDRKVQDKDKIHLQYTGYLDDKAFDGGSTGKDGTDYTIGGNYIPTLNDQLIGLECGKEYSLNCKFPDNYGKEELNGKDVVFKVTVDYIYGDDIVPEWNDDFINTITEGKYTTTADYEAYMKESLKSSNETKQNESYRAALWAKIIDNTKISEYPQDKHDEVYNQFYEYMVNSYKSMASKYSMKYEEVLKAYGITEDDIKKTCEEQAKSQLEYCMVAYEIASKENIELSDDEYNEMAEKYAKYVGYSSIADMQKAMSQQYLYDSFLISKVSDYLSDKNNMVVKDATEATTAAE